MAQTELGKAEADWQRRSDVDNVVSAALNLSAHSLMIITAQCRCRIP